MATTFFNTKPISLSMKSPETGALLAANVYTLEGVTNADGSLRPMSVGQLVMAVCLSRATELESKILVEMEEMAETTDRLDRYSRVEADLANWQKDNPNAMLTLAVINANAAAYPDLYAAFGDATKRAQFLSDIGMSTSQTSWTPDEVDEIMQKTEEQMDSLNTISQEKLIDIQSLTSKRDDTYSLVSNVLKSLYTVMTGNVNNL